MPVKYIVFEPFYGGSHRQLIDTVFSQRTNTEVLKLPAKKWHWKARTSALLFSQQINERNIDVRSVETVFSSSVLNLAELVALVPLLVPCRKILYFHENQLQYPVRKDQNRDFQYGYNQILSCLVADVVLFNSEYNLKSFLESIPKFLKIIPDSRPDGGKIVGEIRGKCEVLYYAVNLPSLNSYITLKDDSTLHILWPHRWEHDKDPETFFSVIEELKRENLPFRLSVLGETFETVPEIFQKVKERLSTNIVAWGYQESKEDYYRTLASCHVVVSTAIHEFFGVAMLEAIHLGCYPIAPNRLVYPELFPDECLYNTSAQLAKKLRYFCRYPHKSQLLKMNVGQYSWESLKTKYEDILRCEEIHAR